MSTISPGILVFNLVSLKGIILSLWVESVNIIISLLGPETIKKRQIISVKNHSYFFTDNDICQRFQKALEPDGS